MSAKPEERQIRASVPEGVNTFRTQASSSERLELARKTLSAYLARASTAPSQPTAAASPADQRRKSAAPKTPTLRADSLRLLAQREHTAAELRRKLARKQARRMAMTQGLSPEDEHPSEESAPACLTGEVDAEIETLLAELAQRGWQSDQRYAEVMIRRLAGQVSQRMIRERLMQAGVSREDVAKAWSAQAEPLPDDAVVAQQIWERRYGQAPSHDKERQRQVRYLLGRGFALSLALRVVPKVKHQEPSG